MNAANSNGLGMPPRFWSKVDRNGPEARAGLGPCWIWTAYRMPKGYGQFGVGSTKDGSAGMELVHRFVLAAKLGRPIADGLDACHACDVRACCNPDHLFEGTPAENSADMVTKGRQRKGESHPHHRLTDGEVLAIRSASGTQEEIAIRFGVNQSTVGKIRRRIRWRHVA